MRKLILKCGLALGDIIMLTAAVRDLHRCCPRQFLTDVRTSCSEVWENNPYISLLSDDDKEAEQIDCSYPLIDRCSTTPYHCLHGFIEFLSEHLRVAIKPTAYRGDIHLSEQERAWYSQVREVTGRDIPFWIIDAGGKYDVTVKWWQTERYQRVVDHFRGKIQFVQVGQWGHHHPKLNGVIDLRGKTSVRELVRLVYHSQGVLCPVTSLMHLAAAVEQKGRHATPRPCVVIAGAREPAHWEAYPGHQFIHTNGALVCGAPCGCWKDRSGALRDGDKRDHLDHRCLNLVESLPRCMDMITPEEVVRRIELYFSGGALRYLSGFQWQAAKRGISATARNSYDGQILNLSSAGHALDRFVQALVPYSGEHQGRGIVICGGGSRYFACAWVCINMLRLTGCRLPIEFWYLGKHEMTQQMVNLLEPLDVKCIDATLTRKQHPARKLGGWELKPYAILHSRFREVLLLDADNVPVVNPEFLFDSSEFQKTGAIFWPDYPRQNPKAAAIWRSCGANRPREPEFETGQIVVDKQRCWPALQLTMWLNENSDFYYQYVHGDKETFHLAFRRLRQPYSLVETAIHSLPATMCQHDFSGRRIFQHRNLDKWDLFLFNRKVPGFLFEDECREFVRQLQRQWHGNVHLNRRNGQAPFRCKIPNRELRIQAVMISCPERDFVRQATLDNLRSTDWPDLSVFVQMDEGDGVDREARQTRCAYRALRQALERNADYVLFLEDDLEFNRHLKHNLTNWSPLKNGEVALASLYNPGLREVGCDFLGRARIVEPHIVFGSQAFLLSRPTLDYIVRNWHRVPGKQDIKISRLAGRLQRPILYHVPSLIQHSGKQSLWGGWFHTARDFDREWRG